MTMEWISVKDKLPELTNEFYDRKCSDDLLIAFHNDLNDEPDITIGYCREDKTTIDGILWFDFIQNDGVYGDVTHWMPLPEPPKE